MGYLYCLSGSHLSLLLIAGEVLPEGTSASQWKKVYTDSIKSGYKLWLVNM